MILENWAHDAAGKQVARQVLTLHGCPPWRGATSGTRRQRVRRSRRSQGTSTSILIGPTPSSSRFSALETRDGMRWRFSYYTSEAFGRMIPWPLSYDSHELIEFTGALEGLKDLKGEMRLSPEGFELWKQLQVENRRQIEAVSGIDPASETCGSMLAASPAKTLKLAMIFEVCRWLKDKTKEWQVIAADTLGLAATHEAGCVSANRSLDAGEASIDAVNREADRIRQKRHQHCKPDVEYVQAPIARR